MADAFAAIADETRRRILTCLAEDGGELNVSTLVDRLGLTQPTISKHLKVLRDVGLVEVREDGQRRFYRVAAAGFVPVSGWIVRFVSAPRPDAPPGSADGFKAVPAQVDRLGFPPPSPSTLARSAGRLAASAVGAVALARRAVSRLVSGVVRRPRS